MTQLRVYNNPEHPRLELESSLPMEIAELLEDASIPYQKIRIDHAQVDQAGLLRELHEMVKRDFPQNRFDSCAPLAVSAAYPNYDRIRLKYLSEHTLDQDEAYLVLEGVSLVSFHLEGKIIQLQCEKGDFVIIPAHVRRWIDIGDRAQLKGIKCTCQEEMPPIFYTGSNISDRFPRLGSN